MYPGHDQVRQVAAILGGLAVAPVRGFYTSLARRCACFETIFDLNISQEIGQEEPNI
jgi:hypothetical protein